jgi:hypothetical protein
VPIDLKGLEERLKRRAEARQTRYGPLTPEEEAAIAASVAINLATLATTGGEDGFRGLGWRYVTYEQVRTARMLFHEICKHVGWVDDDGQKTRPISEAAAKEWPLVDLSKTELRTRGQVRRVRVELATQTAARLMTLLRAGHAWRDEFVYGRLVFLLKECRWHLARENEDTKLLDFILSLTPATAREAYAREAAEEEQED